MKFIRSIIVPTFLAAVAVFAIGCSGSDDSSASKPSSSVLDDYLRVSTALFQDDLAGAKAAAAEVAKDGDSVLAAPAAALAQSQTIVEAREKFIPLSAGAIELSKGETGFHIISCPMVKDGQWVQTDTSVKNPYMGQKMPGCGTVKQ